MINLSACVEMIYSELPFEERIARVREAGFDAYEFWGWANKDIAAIGEAQKKYDLPCAACGVATRNAELQTAYGNGGMLRPENAPLLAEIVADTVEAMRPIGVKTFLVTTGNELDGVCRDAQHASIVTCLRAAAPVAEKAGVTLALEPLNTLVDHKGYFLSRSDEGFAILREVNSPNVKLLFDIYHQQITEGNLIQNITRDIGLIAHFHLADVPGRHQPGTGEINYNSVFHAIEGTGYGAYVGCEYRRTKDVTEEDGARLILGYAHRG